MTKTILQVNFNYKAPESDLAKSSATMATAIAKVPGLIWKTWGIDMGRKEMQGIYLFEDKTSANNYLSGEIFTAIKNNPALANLNTKQFDVVEDLTKITRGPIQLLHA